MNLNEIAEADLSFTLEDSENGFGVDLTLKDLNDNEYPVSLQTNDISFFIDLQSGASVYSRQVELNGRISTITALASDLPAKNWKVDYIDTNGVSWSAIVVNISPDRKLGIYKLILGSFNKNAVTVEN